VGFTETIPALYYRYGPVEGGSAVMVEPAQFGGTRHLSAQFVHEQRDAIALSRHRMADSPSSRGSPNGEIVHAHRIDALLL
jgi:hypothetical protein